MVSPPIWDEFASQVAAACGVPLTKLSVPPKEASAADFSCSIAFELARERRQPPAKIAAELAAGIDISKYPLIEKVEAAGGYLNFSVKKGELFRRAVSAALDQGKDYGSLAARQEAVLIEFPSVNPNKPWHIGHARNGVLGDTLARVFQAAGRQVTRLDYIDDLGLQVAKVYWGTKNLSSGLQAGQKRDLALGLLYVDVEKAAGDPKVEEQIRGIMHGMEKGVQPVAGEARALAEECVRAQYQTAYRLQVFHDLQVYESDIVGAGLFSRALDRMLRSGIVSRAEAGDKAGCIVCNVAGMPGFENLTDPDVVLVRSDGTATYAAKDIAFHMWKFGLAENPFKFSDFEAQPNGATVRKSSAEGEHVKLPEYSVAVNVIGAEQAHPQRLVQSILGGLGFAAEAANLYHLSYEHVWLPEGKFSGRKGTWVGFSVDEVLDEAVSRARAEVEKRNPNLPEEEKAKIAEAVGVGAVRYVLLKYAPEKKITFRWEEALSFEGDSAPYLQYALARCKRILEKAGKAPEAPEDLESLEEAEFELAKQIAMLPSVVGKVAGSLKKEVWGTRTELPRIPEYCYELATRLSSFYTKCRVLGSEHEARRLALVQAAYWALHSSLGLLGIPVVERM